MAVSLILRKVIILSGMISKKELNKSLQDEIGNIGTKKVDETDIQDNYTLRYDV